MHREPQPVKLYTIASMYRYGAPGRGRYREHWQASVEALGSDDPSIDAEPGKILHELRRGRAAETWFGRYYGSADATPLFLVLLSEVWRWTADADLVERLREPALAALGQDLDDPVGQQRPAGADADHVDVRPVALDDLERHPAQHPPHAHRVEQLGFLDQVLIGGGGPYGHVRNKSADTCS